MKRLIAPKLPAAFALVPLVLAALTFGCEDNPTTNDQDPLMPSPTDDSAVTDDTSTDDDSVGGGSSTGGVSVPGQGDDSDDPIISDSDADKCKPTTCEALGFNCGVTPDGCGDSLDCGACPEGQLCGFETSNVCKAPPECVGASSCAELGWECGVAVDDCGNTFDCAAEGLACNELEVCIGGEDGRTVCQAGLGGPEGCDVCDGIAECDDATPTILTGRVVTPGRADGDAANQVGVPNAFVYILTNNDSGLLPAFTDGIPDGGTACDRCDGQDLGPVLAGATTDALGYFQIQENVPVGVEFLLVTKVGRFRRAVPVVVPETGACSTNEVALTDSRLPRSMADGVAVNIPKIAVATGSIDAMECVFEKMGVDQAEFGVGDAAGTERIHLYGTDGAEMPEGNPDETDLTEDSARMTLYDMLVLDCRGTTYLNPPDGDALDAVRDYVNRGGRMFASHLSYQYICRNGTTTYSEDTAIDTGLAPAGDFPGCENSPLETDATGVGLVSTGRPDANPAKIDDFAAWLENEGAAVPNADGIHEFNILEPRNLAEGVGEFSEEFVHRSDEPSVQQFAFNTPYGSPEEAACGRVAYSGFHVSAATAGSGAGDDDDDPDAGAPMGGGGGGFGGGNTPFRNAVFPEHCAGDLTAQEKVLLWMLFDLGACVGDPPAPPVCEPTTCEAVEAECGLINDGCGMAVDCGPCPPGEVCGLVEPNKCAACEPRTCDEVEIECGTTGDGCGGALTCECPNGVACGLIGPNKCGNPDIAN